MKFLYLTIISFIMLTFSSQSQHFLDDDEIRKLEKIATEGNIEASLKLANHYWHTEQNYKKEMYWYESAIESGSLFAISNYSSVVMREQSNRFNDLKHYLDMASSLEILSAKNDLLKLCENYMKCQYSVFYELVELVLKDSKEYSSKFMCHVVDNISTYSKEQLSVVLSMFENNKDNFKKYSKCGERFLSEEIMNKLESNSSEKLVLNIGHWINYYRKNPNSSTEEQDLFLFSIDKRKDTK